jgi:protein O-mannosyl-transferase
VGRYLGLSAAFALGLMSKPMSVTLPAVLLLLDFWPLSRLAPGRVSPSALYPLIREKVPLFALSAVSCALTWLAQADGGAVVSVEEVPLGARVANAALSCLSYLVKMAWPTSLAVFYPHPGVAHGGIPWWQVAGSALVLGGVSFLVLWQRKSRPYLAVGWLWYLVTLVPVIGIVQVGAQGMADRYTYVPLVGPFIAIVWGVCEAAAGRRLWLRASSAVGVVLLVACGALARAQTAYWRDDFALYRHALEVTRDNWTAWNGLANAHFHDGELDRAVQAFGEALRIQPGNARTWLDLGITYGAMSEHAAAIQAVQQALRIDPGNATAWTSLGAHYGALGRHAEALECLGEALRIRPDDEDAWYDTGVAYAFQGQSERALEALERLRRMSPARARQLAQTIGKIAGRER